MRAAPEHGRRRRLSLGSVGVALVLFALGASALAEETPYSAEGADTCLACHATQEVLGIFKTPHARRGDPRTPFAGLQCEACHGPGGTHATGGDPWPVIPHFGAKSAAPVAEANGMCLECHRDQTGPSWHGSAHESADRSCTDCHSVHTPADPTLERATRNGVCFECHERQRADSFLVSSHPIRYGKMSCTDCHSPHGSGSEAELVRNTVNETCYTCHAETRGPFVWEHAPVVEDCTLCHRVHGSNHPALLERRSPLLCQQCHSQAGHPAVAYTTEGLPENTPSAFLLSSGCLNCHSQIHGSNHPSGAALTR